MVGFKEEVCAHRPKYTVWATEPAQRPPQTLHHIHPMNGTTPDTLAPSLSALKPTLFKAYKQPLETSSTQGIPEKTQTIDQGGV